MKLYLLSTAYGSVPRGLFVSGAPWKSVRFPILGFLIERKGELVLFDTGLGERIHDEMKPMKYRQNWIFSKFIMKTKFDPASDPIARQLPGLGFDPQSVKHVILSHLHWDHAGGMLDFPHAEFIIGKREWESATAPDSHRHAYIREQYDRPELRKRLVSADPGKPFLGFPASYDVFGDGNFTLVDLPGHTNGLMGLILTMPSGRKFLLGGDSFYFPENLENRAPKSKLMKKLVHEKDQADITIGKLHDLMTQEPSIEMIGCHDHRIPGRYNLAPQWYD
ncbi:MAG: MBL fold metallo-hydrolase [Spirochaetes bacterium]|nr:MBL fold metallo-hydrolase [Spirochaetota bacterium]